jgi:hypothetical protein
MHKFGTYVSDYHCNKLNFHTFDKKLPIARLIAWAIDQELQKEKPFDIPLQFPEERYEEYAYADQAGKILQYMTDHEAMGIDQFIIGRFDIGISDIDELLLGLRECVEKGFLEAYKPKANIYAKSEFPDDYYYYRLKDRNYKANKRVRREASQFQKFQRLKKKFEGK